MINSESQIEKRIIPIILIGFFLLILPLFFARIHEDEVIYLNQAKNLTFFRVPFVYVISHPLALLDNLLLLRVFIVFFTLSSSILIYLIVRRYADTILPSILFLTSFCVLRWGIRFNFEPTATFFLLLSIYYLEKQKNFESGLSFGLSAISRETMLVILPSILSSSNNKLKFGLPSVLVILVGYATLILFSFYSGSLPTAAVNFSDFFANPTFIPAVIIQNLKNWIFFVFGYLIIISGLLFSLKYERQLFKKYMLLSLPLILILNLVAGFIINGPFERYTIPLVALLSIPAGVGLSRLKNQKLIYLGILVFLILSNIAVVYSSSTEANSVWDFGYQNDEKIIQFLKDNSRHGDLIVGIHGYFVDNVSVAYVERHIDIGIKLNPEWLITYKTWVNMKGGKYYEFGRYYVIPRESLKFVRVKERPYWILNDFPLSGVKEERLPIWLKRYS